MSDVQAKPRIVPLNKRGMSFETFMWVFTRATALGMYGFILLGVIGAIIMGAQYQMTFVETLRWALVTNPGHVTYTNVPDIAPWASVFWRLVASGMFLTALAHGIHGVIVILDDYLATKTARDWNRYGNMFMFFVVMGAGLYIIWNA
jgi:succinate dehydrogenase hydrophobic anchor subunit